MNKSKEVLGENLCGKKLGAGLYLLLPRVTTPLNASKRVPTPKAWAFYLQGLRSLKSGNFGSKTLSECFNYFMKKRENTICYINLI